MVSSESPFGILLEGPRQVLSLEAVVPSPLPDTLSGLWGNPASAFDVSTGEWGVVRHCPSVQICSRDADTVYWFQFGLFGAILTPPPPPPPKHLPEMTWDPFNFKCVFC